MKTETFPNFLPDPNVGLTIPFRTSVQDEVPSSTRFCVKGANGSHETKLILQNMNAGKLKCWK